MGYAPGWQIRCRKCGLTVEAGIGGMVRIWAIGRSYRLGKCSACDRLRWLIVEKRADPGGAANPKKGYAPGWIIRCPSCNRQRDAGEAGLIIEDSKPHPTLLRGPCSKCGKKQWLLIEKADRKSVAQAVL